MIDRRAMARELIAVLRDDAELQRELRAVLGPAPSEGPRFVSVSTYAREHEIGESTVRRAITEGRLAHTRVGHSLRIEATATIAAPQGTDTPASRANRAWARISRGA